MANATASHGFTTGLARVSTEKYSPTSKTSEFHDRLVHFGQGLWINASVEGMAACVLTGNQARIDQRYKGDTDQLNNTELNVVLGHTREQEPIDERILRDSIQGMPCK